MSLSPGSSTVDVFNLEVQLQEKINELQWKSQALEVSQQELLKLRQESLNKDVILEDTKRIITDLKAQLATARQVIEWIENNKSKHMNEKIQLQINCEAALKERESLLEQAHAAKLENMTLKLNVQKLTEAVSVNESAKKALEVSLSEAHEKFSQVNNSLQSNITKLEREHQLLHGSLKSTIQLNKRLQTVGLCTHAIYAKKNEEIKRLQQQLVSNTQADVLPPQISFNKFMNLRKSKFDAKSVLEEVRIDAEKDIEADNEIEAILAEIGSN